MNTQLLRVLEALFSVFSFLLFWKVFEYFSFVGAVAIIFMWALVFWLLIKLKKKVKKGVK
ncbi:hypothetical protein N9W21_09100 [Shewanella sp.]|nr:hypothetical protein [Shewanella sp.]